MSAFRAATVPNGCYQTMKDAVKCIVQKHDFNCHYDKNKKCEGYEAVMLERKNLPPGQIPWDFSEPD